MDLNATPVLASLYDDAKTHLPFWDKDVDVAPNTPRLKYSAVRKRFPDAPANAIAMWIADMNIPPPLAVINALKKNINEEYGYQECSISEAVCEWHSQHVLDIANESSLLPEHIVDVASVISFIDLALQTFCCEGDKVMFLSPTYEPLRNVISLNKLMPIPVPLSNEEDQSTGNKGNASLETIDTELLDSTAKAFILCHPNNPTGTVLSSENQAELIAFCELNDILLIVDEVHGDFGFLPYVQPSGIPLFGAARGMLCSPNVIHVGSASKTFNLASVPGASYAIIPDKARRETIKRNLNAKHLYASNLSKVALNAAYKLGEKWLEKVRAAIAFNRYLVDTFFSYHKLEWDYTMGAAGYFLWISLTSNREKLRPQSGRASNGREYDCETQHDSIERGVIGSDGVAFGKPGYIRLNLACHPETIELALNRLCFSNFNHSK